MNRIFKVSPDNEYYGVDLVIAESNSQARSIAFASQECCIGANFTELRAKLLKGGDGLQLTLEGEYPIRSVNIFGKGPVEAPGEPRIIDASNWESELQEILGERFSIETITEEDIFE